MINIKDFMAKFNKPLKKSIEEEPDFYGGDNTWHGTGTVDVQLNEDGDVVAVWYRCRLLPFTQSTSTFPAGKKPIQPHGSIKGILFKEEYE